MKFKLAAAVYIYSAGKCWRNTRSAMSSSSLVTLFDRRHCEINCRFQAEGFDSSSRAAHSSALEGDSFSELGPGISECSTKKIKLVTEKPGDFLEDDFSELGPGISERSAKQIKLVTEKPDHLVKTRPRKRDLASKRLSSDNRPSVKEIMAAICQASTISGPKFGNHDHAAKFTGDTGKISDIESPCSVSVKNIPPKVGLSELVEAISIFGKVSGASFVGTSNKLRCCNIEFEDADSSRRAILAGKIAVGSQVFPVNPLDAVDLVTIRISNINEKTTDYAIHAICKSIGEFVGLTRTSKDCVDAFFNVQNHTVHLDIVEKFNNTVLDLNHWSARVLTSKSKSSEVPSDEEAKYKSRLRILDHFSELRRQVALKRICLEDLEYLSACIMHIEGVSAATNPSDSR